MDSLTHQIATRLQRGPQMYIMPVNAKGHWLEKLTAFTEPTIPEDRADPVSSVQIPGSVLGIQRLGTGWFVPSTAVWLRRFSLHVSERQPMR